MIKSTSHKSSTVQSSAVPLPKLAVILVRGMARMPGPIKDTLAMLSLHRKNHCVVVDNTPMNQGMIVKVKDYVTWGEIDQDTFDQLLATRGIEYHGRATDSKGKYAYKVLQANGKKYKKYFRLNPPRQGFGWKGIKIAYAAGGALGYRGKEINDLLEKMM